jgi:LPS-assembly protein
MHIKTIASFATVFTSILFLTEAALAESKNAPAFYLSQEDIIQKLGWVQTNDNRCGGHYIEAPFASSEAPLVDNKLIRITSNELLFAQHGTSIGQGEVTITRFGQQIIASKAYLYRDPTTGKLNAIELLDNVTLREPNSFFIANRGSFNLETKAESLHDILYRTAIYSNPQNRPATPSVQELQQTRHVYQLSAWGKATLFNQDKPKIYEFDQASYSTCPPTSLAWQVKASHIELNKEAGRGSATHAKILVNGVPIFYAPYLSFPIDARRKSGFLWPIMGISDDKLGPNFGLPYYWNMAPNYDMTITPAYLSKRSAKLSDLFRYLSPNTRGELNLEVLPHDPEFIRFQKEMEAYYSHLDPELPANQATLGKLNQLKNNSALRYAMNWENKTRFNEHWSSNVDFNYVSDDYYLRDIDKNFNQITQNQLLQLAELDYKGQNWNFITRFQGYQTLHPVDEKTYFRNQYTRFPQFIFNGDYPDRAGGFEYFIDNEATHFDIRHNPGLDLTLPIGNRLNTQPGIARPINLPYLSVVPRLQFALTKYSLGNVDDTNPENPGRALPIIDVDAATYLDRNIKLFGYNFSQTLEPRAYYTYIPYRNQNDLPIFDTTVNTLTYDQLFIYNRFSGIDRINDANQIAMGLTTRLIDQQTGVEKVKAALGQIVYFRDRKVTLCQTTGDFICPPSTSDFAGSGVKDVDNNNKRMLSPLSGLLTYMVNPNWSATANTIWNPQTRNLDNQSIGVHYQPLSTLKVINFGYNFVRKGDVLAGDRADSSASNLSSTDLSLNWPILRDWTAIGRWTQNWNHKHFQNLLYGLQYDSCCWAIRLVTGRAFVGLTPNNTFQYNTQFYMHFALKGLGSVPVYGGDPSQLLNTNISGIQNTFGRDF